MIHPGPYIKILRIYVWHCLFYFHSCNFFLLLVRLNFRVYSLNICTLICLTASFIDISLIHFKHNIFVAKYYTVVHLVRIAPEPWDLSYWILHQSHSDVHILLLVLQWEMFIALEVMHLLTISTPKHMLFAIRSGPERTGGKWHVGWYFAMKFR